MIYSTIHHSTSREGNVALNATPNPFLFNAICLNQFYTVRLYWTSGKLGLMRWILVCLVPQKQDRSAAQRVTTVLRLLLIGIKHCYQCVQTIDISNINLLNSGERRIFCIYQQNIDITEFSNYGKLLYIRKSIWCIESYERLHKWTKEILTILFIYTATDILLLFKPDITILGITITICGYPYICSCKK